MKLTFQAVPVTLDAAAGEEAPRTITGIAVPWDSVAIVSSGEKVLVRRGAFDLSSKPKLLEGHDMTQLRGVVNELVDSDEGLLFQATFAKTRAADDAVELVKASAYDSVSAGFTPTKYKYDKKGVLVVEKAEIHEVSLVAMPAWKQAVITEIAASSPEEGEEEATTENTEEGNTVENNEVVEAQAETIPTNPILFAQAKREFKLPTAPEYISTMLKGGAEWAQMSSRIQAGAPDVLTSDLDGILPVPIVQPVMNSLIGRRNLIEAVGTRAMPQGGKVFIRPSVTTHTSIAAVTENNNNIQSGTFVITDNQVTKAQYGGYVEVSQFSLDVTQPEVVSLLLDDMARVYAKQTEIAVEIAFGNGITETLVEPTSYASPADWSAWVWGATSTVLAESSQLPTHLFVGTDQFADLGQLVDDSGRPLFYAERANNPMNAFGQLSPGSTMGSAFGLSVVVLPYSADFLAVGNYQGFEVFEDLRGALSVNVPNQLSRTIAWYGYLASLMIEPSMFVKAVAA
jgi:HK97 family phage prohead protease